MSKRLASKTPYLLMGCILFMAGWLAGQQKAATEKTLIHAAAWTSLKDMKQEDLDAFRRVTAGMIGKVPGLRRAWIGKLNKPLVDGKLTRDYGIILEFDDLKAWDSYFNSRPQQFMDAFSKIRIPDSTNFNVIGE